MPTWSEVRAVDWSALEGAYGTDRDVPTALEIMRWADDAEDDEFSDAWLDVLCSHVWHQGTIYPITAPVLPFVFDIVDHSPALKSPTCYARSEIAQFVTWCASSARRAVTSGKDDDRFNGQSVLSVLAAHADRLRKWKDSDLQTEGITAMLLVSELRGPLLASAETEPNAVLASILGHARWLGSPEFEWAARALVELPHPVAKRAASILVGGEIEELDADRLAALGDALESRGELAARLDPLREQYGIRVKTHLEVAGESSAIVTVCEEDWFVAQTVRNITVRWPAHPFAEGDSVVLRDVNKRNVPREVLGTGAKSQFRARFDERGRFEGG